MYHPAFLIFYERMSDYLSAALWRAYELEQIEGFFSLHINTCLTLSELFVAKSVFTAPGQHSFISLDPETSHI